MPTEAAYNKEFFTIKTPRTEHVNTIKLSGNMNNNKMERLNGELRDREKVMRNLKIKNTPILAGYQLFHNYFRGHQGLKGKTPAQVCGIKIEGENKWMTLIQNSAILKDCRNNSANHVEDTTYIFPFRLVIPHSHRLIHIDYQFSRRTHSCSCSYSNHFVTCCMSILELVNEYQIAVFLYVHLPRLHVLFLLPLFLLLPHLLIISIVLDFDFFLHRLKPLERQIKF